MARKIGFKLIILTIRGVIEPIRRSLIQKSTRTGGEKTAARVAVAANSEALKDLGQLILARRRSTKQLGGIAKILLTNVFEWSIRLTVRTFRRITELITLEFRA